jgi:hypothetical protein
MLVFLPPLLIWTFVLIDFLLLVPLTPTPLKVYPEHYSCIIVSKV